ncbi:MAG TPA: glycerol kinase GlpK, partial [Acidimicrobiales bacterium]|nr:glycerol kinase GlpK [Acidimicrobiales bacterium]
RSAGLRPSDLAAVGITNQRETTVIWDRRTGRPFSNAIVWQDMRSAPYMDRLGDTAALVSERTGLVPAPYFSAGKLRWALDNIPGLQGAAEAGNACFGTVDSWLVWNFTGGRHVTDATNASRTMLMDLRTLSWAPELLEIFAIPEAMLPEIVPSSGIVGTVEGSVPLAGVLGDQQAAMLGQVCCAPGEAKNTYGTGSFLLINTGTSPVRSYDGLLSTVCYHDGVAPTYALEGSIAVTGSAVQWLRDQLGIIDDAAESEHLASQVPDSGGVYFVPAFSGLFAPYWQADARGIIAGLTRATTRAHIARATLEAICYQTRDVLEVMPGAKAPLKVDGGVTANDLCMQLQADILGMAVSRPVVRETTALGAAYAAGCAVGFWDGTDQLRQHWKQDRCFEPTWSEDKRESAYAGWKSAVQRSMHWPGAGKELK